MHGHWVCMIPRLGEINEIHSSVTFANAVPSPQLEYCLKVQADMIDILTDHKRPITTGLVWFGLRLRAMIRRPF